MYIYIYKYTHINIYILIHNFIYVYISLAGLLHLFKPPTLNGRANRLDLHHRPPDSGRSGGAIARGTPSNLHACSTCSNHQPFQGRFPEK